VLSNPGPIEEFNDFLGVNRWSGGVEERLSTIRNADMIVLLRDGAVPETGSNDQLLALPEAPTPGWSTCRMAPV
jgi:hypothetical protein